MTYEIVDEVCYLTIFVVLNRQCPIPHPVLRLRGEALRLGLLQGRRGGGWGGRHVPVRPGERGRASDLHRGADSSTDAAQPQRP